MVLTFGFRYFWKWGNIRKSVHWNRRLRVLSIYTLDWGFKKIPLTLDTYVLAKVSQNGAKFRYTEANFQNYRNLNNFQQAALESLKSWNLMDFCQKNYILSAKTLYTVDLSNITFNYLCIDSPNYLCHFWNHKSIFTIQLLCIFLTQTLHTFHKHSSSKYKFSDFPLLWLKFSKFLMSYFK